MNGGVLQEDSVPMHLTNGYADNMLTNVCLHLTVMHVLFSATFVNSLCLDLNFTY